MHCLNQVELSQSYYIILDRTQGIKIVDGLYLDQVVGPLYRLSVRRLGPRYYNSIGYIELVVLHAYPCPNV